MTILSHIALSLGLIVAGYCVLYLALVFVLGLFTPVVQFPSGRRVRIRFNALLPRLFGHDGTTVFGIVWVAAASTTKDLIAHEYQHTQQEKALLYVGFLPVYYWCMWRAGSYLGDRLEVEARAFSAAHLNEFTDLAAA